MAKYNILITQEPGALLIEVRRGADGVDLWRGRCVPSEKDKTIAEAMYEISNGKSMLDALRDGYEYKDPDANKHTREFDTFLNSGAKEKLAEKVMKDHGKDFRIVDLTEGG